ncbi:hypothetical protein [Pararhodonellum marinum]|uniref:hypothetical protein n=1 Tax=Pararhodonellum marinum TaxID=2755358 RepID=UPI00188ECB6B|nr:hypothetical protein [Pararhodonellum marinum]
MNEFIQFKKQRELGSMLSDTFKFMRIHFKPLARVLIKTSGIPFLLLLVFSGYYTHLTQGGTEPFSSASIPVLFLMGISSLVYYILMGSTVLNYIKTYINSGGTVEESTVVSNSFQYSGTLLAFTLVSLFMLVFGLMFFIIPGIYFYVPLYLAFTMIIFKDLGALQAISAGFNLVSDRWWVTFGTIMVIGIVLFIISYVFQMPAMIYLLVRTFAVADEVSSASGAGLDFIAIFLDLISNIASYLISVVAMVAAAFIYFDLNEYKNRTGLLEKIETLEKAND